MFTFAPIQVGKPTKPGNNGTVTLFDSTVTFNGMGLAMNGIGRIRFDFGGIDQASAANGFKGYTSNDKGATWNLYTFAVTGGSTSLPVAVPADTAADHTAFDIYVANCRDVKFTYTAGATAPSAATWNPVIILQAGDVHPAA